jgi:hypothetical protein
MRLILAVAAAGLLASAASADTMKNCAAAWKAKAPDAVAARTYKAWSTKCLAKGYTAPAAAAAAAPPAGATAQCKDGSYSMSKTASGRCSHHGGVANVL